MKKLLSVFLMIAIVTSFAACGGGSGSTVPASPGSGETPAPSGGGASGTISFYYWGDEQKSGMEKIVELYKDVNPDVTVELTLIPGRDQYYVNLQAALPVGTGPDIMWHNANIADYLDYLIPLDDLVADSDIGLSDYPQVIVDFYTFGGTLYAIPKDFDTIAIFYNKAIFDDLGVDYPASGWTWDDFLETARALTNDEHFGFACDFNDSQIGYGNFVRQQRGAAIHPTGDAPVLVNDASMVEGIQFLADLMYTHNVATPANEITEMPAADQFMGGKAAMLSHGSWMVGPIHSVLGDNLGIVELPIGAHQACQINGLGYAIYKDTKNFDAAWDFLQFLASKEGQAATSQVVIPAFTGAADEWLAAYPNLNLQLFLDATGYAHAEYPYLQDSRKINQIQTDHVSAILTDPGHNIQAELDAAQAAMEAALQ